MLGFWVIWLSDSNIKCFWRFKKKSLLKLPSYVCEIGGGKESKMN